MSGSATPMYFSGTRASSESGEVGMYMQGGDMGSQGSFQQENGYGGQGQMYSIHEQSAYHQGYSQGDFQGHSFEGQSHYQQEVAADSQLQVQDTTAVGQGQLTGGNQWQQYTGGEGHQQQSGTEPQANWQQGTNIKWASSRENLSSGFATKVDSNRPVRPQKQARVLKFLL